MGTTTKSLAGFSTNSRVDHSVYGVGTILDLNERYTTIAFDVAGTKKFVTAMVQLVRSDTLAPEKPVRKKKKVVRPN